MSNNIFTFNLKNSQKRILQYLFELKNMNIAQNMPLHFPCSKRKLACLMLFLFFLVNIFYKNNNNENKDGQTEDIDMIDNYMR